MKWRRAFLIALGALLAAPVIVEAQQKAKIPRVGYLTLGSASWNPRYLEAFRDGLRALGYTEGRTLFIDFRSANGDPKLLTALGAELVHELKVDVMLIPGCGRLHIDAVRTASKTVPMVVAICGDLPGFQGEVASFARPGGNTTGMTMLAPELAAKRLALLKELVPRLSTVSVLWNPDSEGWEPYWRELRKAATALGIALQSVEIRLSSDFDDAFRKIEQSRAAGILTLTDAILWRDHQHIAEFVLRRRLAAAYDFPEFADKSGLLVYGPNIAETFRHASVYVDKILKGAKPAEIPVERPTKFELIVNLRTAKALGLTIPQAILLRADRVIE